MDLLGWEYNNGLIFEVTTKKNKHILNVDNRRLYYTKKTRSAFHESLFFHIITESPA